jgi:hypothetical protein
MFSLGLGLEGPKDFFLVLTALGEKSDRTVSNRDDRRVFTMRMFGNKNAHASRIESWEIQVFVSVCFGLINALLLTRCKREMKKKGSRLVSVAQRFLWVFSNSTYLLVHFVHGLTVQRQHRAS